MKIWGMKGISAAKRQSPGKGQGGVGKMVAIKPCREKLPTPPVEIVCQRCGVKFLAKRYGTGRTRYCIECKVIVYDENKNKQRDQRREERRLAKAVRDRE